LKGITVFSEFPLRKGALLVASFPGANFIPYLNCVDSEIVVLQFEFDF
jgi:hypothetical protein